MSNENSDTNVSSAVAELSQEFNNYNLSNSDFEDIFNQFEDTEVGVEDISEQIRNFISYGVTDSGELRNAVISKITTEHGIEIESTNTSDNRVDIVEIDEAEEWVTIVGEVVQLFESNSESIEQVGLIDDGTDVIKFTAWAKADAPELSEGMVYELSDVITSEYEGEYSVEVNSQSEINSSSEDIATSGEEVTFGGHVVSVNDRSGLIARDEDGDVVNASKVDDYEDDLRLMVTLDNGEQTFTAVFDREETEEFTGIELDEAKQMAMDAIDREVVLQEMKPMVRGQYLTVTGPRISDYIYVEEYETGIETKTADKLLVQARTMSGEDN